MTATADDDSLDIEFVGMKNDPKVFGVAVVAPPERIPTPHSTRRRAGLGRSGRHSRRRERERDGVRSRDTHKNTVRIASIETSADETATVGNVTVTFQVGSDALAGRELAEFELRNPETGDVIPFRTLQTNESGATFRASVPVGTSAVLSTTTGSADIDTANSENGTAEPTTESEPVLGFGPGVALAALVVLALLFRRR